MLGCVEMFGRVLVLRRVAAADVPARFAQAQVNPIVSDLQTIFAAIRARRDIANLVQMCAGFHKFLL
jgi:hypothetical protein